MEDGRARPRSMAPTAGLTAGAYRPGGRRIATARSAALHAVNPVEVRCYARVLCVFCPSALTFAASNTESLRLSSGSSIN